jgi:hypothetical protein
MYFISVHIEFYAVKTRPLNAKNDGVITKAGKEYRELLDVIAYLHKNLSVMG